MTPARRNLSGCAIGAFSHAPRRPAGLVDLCADRLDDVAVLRVLGADERRELLRAGCEGLEPADAAYLVARVRAREQPVDLPVQPRDRARRDAGAGEDAQPGLDLESGVDFGEPRQIGKGFRALLARDREPAKLSGL